MLLDSGDIFVQTNSDLYLTFKSALQSFCMSANFVEDEKATACYYNTVKSDDSVITVNNLSSAKAKFCEGSVTVCRKESCTPVHTLNMETLFSGNIYYNQVAGINLDISGE